MEIITIKKRERERKKERDAVWFNPSRVGRHLRFRPAGSTGHTPSTQQEKNNIQKPPKRTISIYIYMWMRGTPLETDQFLSRTRIHIYIYTNRIALASSPTLPSDTFVCVYRRLPSPPEIERRPKGKRENSGVKEPRKEGALCAFV